MEIRQAFPNELDQIKALFASLKQALKPKRDDQQQTIVPYPEEDDIFADILSGQGHVAVLKGQIVAYAALFEGKDESYDKIYDGKWQHNNHHYVIFRRLAVLPAWTNQQIAQTFLQGLIEGQKGPDFRMDIDANDEVMRHILEKLGFIYCGKLPIGEGRLAYQKIKRKNENSFYQEVDEDSYHAY